MHHDPRDIEDLLDDQLITVKEAARILRVSRSTVYRVIALGDLPSVHVGGALRFRASDLRLYIAKGGTSIRPVQLRTSRRARRGR